MDKYIRQYDVEINYINKVNLVGKYRFPQLKATKELPEHVISFHERNSIKDIQNYWIDFFIDDRHFNIISSFPLLTKCKKNIDNHKILKKQQKISSIFKKLQSAKGVIAPDFSLYPDMSLAKRQFNCLKNREITYLMQENGINTIPSVSWSMEEDFDYCFDGIPNNSSIAISTNGCKSEKYSKKIFLMGVAELQRIKHPYKLIICGSGFLELEKYNNIFYYNSFSKRWNIREKNQWINKDYQTFFKF